MRVTHPLGVPLYLGPGVQAVTLRSVSFVYGRLTRVGGAPGDGYGAAPLIFLPSFHGCN